ncbi:MAG: RluA family pseudouridine synthase [Candidatus Marinimicrobia bacterium]|nr:RluA family pseudouridine synthase [Candidatus Neomarinimicrobiota bacterium]
MNDQLYTETDGYDTYCIAVRAAQKPTRIDTFISESIKDISRTKVKELIERELVTVNRETTKKVSYQIAPKDMITVRIPRFVPLAVEPENIPLDVIYEDDYLIVINKPPGLVVHPAVGNRTGTLVNALAHRCTTLSNIGGDYRPGIVHRLDKDTSGAIIAAKNNNAHNRMARKFEYREIDKFYTALVWGVFKEPKGVTTKYIGRHKNDRQKYAAYDDQRFGKAAETRYEVIESFEFVSLVRVQILTGRTHQIRVHLSDLGHPVIGDEFYGGKTQKLAGLSPRHRKIAIQILDMIDRQALHCSEMRFEHPITKEPLRVIAPLPKDMGRLVKHLRETLIIDN